jgi:uncharacterized protein
VRFLLVFLVVLVLAWRWRTWRESVQREAVRNNKSAPSTTDTVACLQCGTHVPAHDAVVGTLGAYCTVAHRLSMEP